MEIYRWPHDHHAKSQKELAIRQTGIQSVTW